MHLILELIGPDVAELGTNRRRVFTEAGGTIGRSSDCDWELPKQFVYAAPRHAVIRYADGAFYIEAIGVNGVAIGDPRNVLERGKPFRLGDGDVICMADSEIKATITRDNKP